MTKRDTMLKQWPPDLPTIAKAIRFRDSLVDHLVWIQQHRRDNRQYDRLAGLYRRQLVSTSQLIARLRAETHKRESQFRKAA